MIAASQFPAVRDDFPKYEAFRLGAKVVEGDNITLSRASEKVEYKAVYPIKCGLDKRCVFQAEQSPKALLKYAFKIFADEFGIAPCLRFCSRGNSHMNPERGQGLSSRRIPTPHFHKVESDGIIDAYQTRPLLDATEGARIVSDLQLGANLFCQEMNLAAPSGGSVAVKIMRTELGLSMNDDPLAEATFPP